MSHGLLKRAGAFLLASAMAMNAAVPGLAESLGPDAGGAEGATEASPPDTDTGATEEDAQPAGSYIICLPEDAGARYSYDAAHRSEEGSDSAFTILLYEAGEQAQIGVDSDLGFALYGTDGSLFLEPEGGELDFIMPDKDLQLVFEETQTETQGQPEAPDGEGSAENPEGSGTPATEGAPAPETGGVQETVGTEAQDPGEETPGTEMPELNGILRWEAPNVTMEIRRADGGSFPEGAALMIDTPDTAMEDEEGALAYGKAAADELGRLMPDAKLWALYPFEASLGDGQALPEGQMEFSVTFSDKEIIDAFRSGIKPAVATYAMDRETLTVSDAKMVAAEDMDAYLTDDGKLAAEFLSEEGTFAIAFVKESEDEAKAEAGALDGTQEGLTEAPEPETGALDGTEAPEPETPGGAVETPEAMETETEMPEAPEESTEALETPADPEGITPGSSAPYTLRVVVPEGAWDGTGLTFTYRLTLPEGAQAGIPAEGSFTVIPGGEHVLEGLPEGTAWVITAEAPEGHPLKQDAWEGVISSGGPETVLTAEPEAAVSYTYELEGDMAVTVELSDGAVLPEGARLQAARLEPGTPEYMEALPAVLGALGLPEEARPALYDIGFVVDGRKVEPMDGVRVSVRFKDDAARPDAGYSVAHVADDGSAKAVEAEGTIDGGVEFQTDSFSIFGFAAIEAAEGVTLSDTLSGSTLISGTEFDISSYVTADPAQYEHQGQPQDVKIRISKVTYTQDGETVDVRMGSGIWHDGTTLKPTEADVQHSPYTVTVEAYVEADGQAIPLTTGGTQYQIADVKVAPQGTILPELNADMAYVSEAGNGTSQDSDAGRAVTDGAAPWDGDSSAGNDSDANNKVVRTYDTVTYKTYFKTAMRADSAAPGFTSSRVYFEFVLPNINGTQAQFEAASMPWLSSTSMDTKYRAEEVGGSLVLRGSFILKADSGTSVIGASEEARPVAIRILRMKNGETVKPRFSYWLAYNDAGMEYEEGGRLIKAGSPLTEASRTCGTHKDAEIKSFEGAAVTVSAKPSYNVQLRGGNNVSNSYVTSFDFGSNAGWPDSGAGTVTEGRSYAYGITLQVKGALGGKGMRGVELPDDGAPITFDLDVSSSFAKAGGTAKTGDADYKWDPLYWAFGAFDTTNGIAGQRAIPAAIPVKYPQQCAPSNKASAGSYDVRNTARDDYIRCYNGGTWSFEQDPSDRKKLHVTVSGYVIDLSKIPSNNYGIGRDTYTYFDYNLTQDYWNLETACFASGALWVVQPYVSADGSDFQTQGGASKDAITTVVKESNLKVTSQEVGAQKVTNDDSVSQGLQRKRPGSYGDYVRYVRYENNSYWWELTDGCANTNADYANIGSKIAVGADIDHTNTDAEYRAGAFDWLVKWDDLFFEPEGSCSLSGYGAMTYKVYWCAYKDTDSGSWHNPEDDLDPASDGYDTAMRSATPEDMLMYASLDALKQAGKACVGVFVELRGARRGDSSLPLVCRGKVSENAKPGGVYMACQTTHAWRLTDVREAATEYLKKKGTEVTGEPTDEQYNAYLRAADGFPSRAGQDAGNTKHYTDHDHPSGDYPKMWMNVYEGYQAGDQISTQTTDVTQLKGYKKASYGADGSYTEGANSSSGGDSCLALGTLSHIKISPLNGTTFDLSNNQRYADIEVTPTFTAQSSKSAEASNVTVTVKIPKGLTYVENSGVLGGEYQQSEGNAYQGQFTDGKVLAETAEDGTYGTVTWTAVKEGDGSTTLTLKLAKVPSPADAPVLHFSCRIGTPGIFETDVANDGREDFKLTATSICDEDRSLKRSEANGNVGTAGILAFKNLGTSLYKGAEQMVVENGSDMEFTMRVSNTGYTAMRNVLIVDTLPFQGDGLSSFHGQPVVTGFSAGGVEASGSYEKLLGAESYQNAEGGKETNFHFYYVTAQAVPDYQGKASDDEVYAIANQQEGEDYGAWRKRVLGLFANGRQGDHGGTAPNFKELASSGSASSGDDGIKLLPFSVPAEEAQKDGARIVAIVAFGDLPAGTTLNMKASMKLPDGEPGDYVVNSLYMGSEHALHAVAYSYIVNRQLGGVAWLDTDRDGVQGAGEAQLPGIKASLWKQEGESYKQVTYGGGSPAYTVTGPGGKNSLDLYRNKYSDDTSLGDGGYLFTNLPDGTYKVVFEDPDGSAILDRYFVTGKDAVKDGAHSEATDSDAVGTYKDKAPYDGGAAVPFLTSAEVSGIEMPPLAQLNSATYQSAHHDVGLYQPTGELRISKTVKNGGGEEALPKGQEAKEFTVTISLRLPDGRPGTDGILADGEPMKLTSGGDGAYTGTFKIRHGQTVKVSGVPSGTGYTVTEADPGPYTQKAEAGGEGNGSTAKAASGSSAGGMMGSPAGDAPDPAPYVTVGFTNTVKTGSVQVTKTLDTKGQDESKIPEKNKAFTFTLSGTSTAGIEISQQKSVTGAGTARFENIPVGAYTISEACDADIWNTQMDGNVTVTEGKEAAVACKNTLKTGSVQVTKTLDTKGIAEGTIPDGKKKFTFTLSGTSDAGTAVSKQAEITGAGSASLEDIPVGTYTVTETCDTGLWAAEGAKQVAVADGEAAGVSFKNTAKTGTVTVTKTLDTKGWEASAVPDASKAFTFTLSGTSTAGIKVSQQKSVAGAGTATFTGIPAGSYTISESCDGALWSTRMDGDITVTAGKDTAVACTNTLKTGEVQVVKTVDTKSVDGGSIPEKDKVFTFTLSGTSAAGIAVNKQATVNGAGSAKFEKIPVGTYTLTEECTTLWTAEGPKQAEVTDGNLTEVRFNNTVNTGTVTVNKTLDTKGWDAAAVPEGSRKFTFKLSGTSDAGIAVSQQKDITGAGKVTFTDIPAGTYSITEECRADVWNTRMEGSVSVKAGQDTAVACTNTLKAGEVQVTKAVDMKGMDAEEVPEENRRFIFNLSGTSAGGIVVDKQVTVTGAGTATFTDIPVGTYSVAERCDTGVWGIEDAKQAAVTDGGSAAVQFGNTILTGSVTVTKTLDLKGAEEEAIPEENKRFTFTLSGTSTAGITINRQATAVGTGSVRFDLVPVGGYTVTETCDTGLWDTESGKRVAVVNGQESSVAFKNTLSTGSVAVSKRLVTKGVAEEEIPDGSRTFTFTLSGTSDAGTEVNIRKEILGTGTARFEDVPAGTYTVTEECDDNLWSMEKPKQAHVAGGEDASVMFTNTLNTGSVAVSKTLDLKGLEEGAVPGKARTFTFTLSGTSDAGTRVSVSKEVFGTGTVRFEDIPVGTYTISESCDLKLWGAEGDKQVTVLNGKEAPAAFKNTLSTGSVTVSKTLELKGVDEDDIPEGNKTFTFTLSGTSEAGVKVSLQKKIAGAGKVSFTDVPVGTYTVTEGCDTDIWDTQMDGAAAVEAGKDTEVACANTLKTGSVQVSKTLEMRGRDVSTLQAADKTFTFILSGTSASGAAISREKDITGTGKALFDNVPVGTYTVTETCDTGLWIPEDGKPVQVAAGKTSKTRFKNTLKVGDLCVSVMDSGTRVELDGAKIAILDADGHVAGTAVSSHDGNVFVKGLEIGKEYTLKVVEPRKGYSNGILTVEGYQSPYQETGYTADGNHFGYSEAKFRGINGNQGTLTLTQGGIQSVNLFLKPVEADIRIQARGEVPAVRIEDGRAADISWELKGIPGAEYGIYAAEAVRHPDGYSEDVLKEGALAGTVKTGADGYATLKGLTPGKYRIKQAKAPTGYLKGDALEAGVMASYEARLWDKADYAAEAFTYDAVSVNDRQVVDLGSDLEPENEDADDPRDPDKGLYKKTGVYRYAVDGEDEAPVEGAGFTLYADKDIVDVYGNVAIPAGTLIETAVTDADGRAIFTSDLPIGEYAARGAGHMEGYYSTAAEAIFDTARYASEDTVKYVRARGEVRDYITVARLFLKDDLTGNELAGATLVVSDAEGTPFATIATEDTAGAGHVIKGLEPGREYVIEETVPRDGYTNTIAIPEGMEGILKKEGRTSASFTLADHIAPSAQDVPADAELEVDNAYVTGSFDVIRDGEELLSVDTRTQKKTFFEKAFDWARSAFTYGSKGQGGGEFTVYAAEDVAHPDGKTGIVYHKGDAVGMLVRSGARPAVAVTDADGKAEFRELYLGHYTVRETKAPEGFAKDPAEASITLAYADYGTQEVGATEGTVEYHSIRQKVAVSVTKRDRDDHNLALEGAVFGICAQEDIAGMDGGAVIKADTLVETAQTGADGVASFTAELPLGKYYVKEILPPKGYASSDERISVDASYQPDGRECLEFAFDFFDGATEADIRKLSEGAGVPVEGARLTLLNSEGETVDTWVTDGLAHRVTGLMPGHAYTLRELKAAPGYATAEDIEFIAADRGADGTLEPQEIAMYDPAVKVRISATERGKDGAESPLDGVELRVTDMEGNEAAINGRTLHWVSQGEAAGYYEGLPAGRYTISAVKVPGGYVKPEAVTIEVKDTTELQEFTIPVGTTVVDIYAMDKETGERVEGAAVSLLGKGRKPAYSDVALEWTQERVPAGKYSVHVKSVPDGYVLPDKDTKIAVRKTSETQYFKLELGVTHLAIQAADKDTGVGVSGVGMRLETEDGKTAAKWTSDGGWEQIERIAPGRYDIVAASVPAGYKAPEKGQIEVKDTEDLQKFALALEKLPQGSVPKTGDDINIDFLADMAALACLLLGFGLPLALHGRKKRN